MHVIKAFSSAKLISVMSRSRDRPSSSARFKKFDFRYRDDNSKLTHEQPGASVPLLRLSPSIPLVSFNSDSRCVVISAWTSSQFKSIALELTYPLRRYFNYVKQLL